MRDSKRCYTGSIRATIQGPWLRALGPYDVDTYTDYKGGVDNTHSSHFYNMTAPAPLINCRGLEDLATPPSSMRSTLVTSHSQH